MLHFNLNSPKFWICSCPRCSHLLAYSSSSFALLTEGHSTKDGYPVKRRYKDLGLPKASETPLYRLILIEDPRTHWAIRRQGRFRSRNRAHHSRDPQRDLQRHWRADQPGPRLPQGDLGGHSSAVCRPWRF